MRGEKALKGRRQQQAVNSGGSPPACVEAGQAHTLMISMENNKKRFSISSLRFTSNMWRMDTRHRAHNPPVLAALLKQALNTGSINVK